MSLGRDIKDVASRALRWADGVDLRAASLSAAARSLRWLDRRAESRPHEPLDELETAVVRALAETLCRYDEPDLPPADAGGTVDFVERYVAQLPVARAATLRRLLAVFEYQPYLFGPRRARFSALSEAERASNVRSWEESTTRWRLAGFEALKTIVMLAYWSRAESWPAIGYSGPLVPRSRSGGR